MDEDRQFKLRQLALSQEVHERLKSQVMAYEVMAQHRDDPDILEQLDSLGLPTSLPTLFRVVQLVVNGVFVPNSAILFLKLAPMTPFPEKDQVRERIWEELGWGER